MATFPPSYPQEILSSPGYIPSDLELGTDASNSEISESNDLDDQDDLVPLNENHKAHDDHSPLLPSSGSSTGYITHATSTTLGQPSLPCLPPYADVMNHTPKGLYAYMQSHQSQCELILNKHTAQC